jgi:hypothetical protein
MSEVVTPPAPSTQPNSAVESAFYERIVHGSSGGPILERTACITGGQVVGMLNARVWYAALGVMAREVPCGRCRRCQAKMGACMDPQQVGHQFVYDLPGAGDPVEAFAMRASCYEEGRRKEAERLRAEMIGKV